jgi:uncharacterized protein with HEPN domain
MSKRPDVYLELALRAVERVPRFLAGRSLEAYLADDLCQSAVERQLEVAGDALGQVRKLDLDLFARVPEGALIVAFRNVLAHGYATLDHRRVYDAATHKVDDSSARYTSCFVNCRKIQRRSGTGLRTMVEPDFAYPFNRPGRVYDGHGELGRYARS